MRDREVEHQSADLLRHFGDSVARGTGKHDGELLAAVARHVLAGPSVSAGHGLRHRPEASVSRLVSVPVVVVLEEIDVEKHEGERRMQAARPPELLVERRVEGPPIENAGQSVLPSQLPETFVRGLDLRRPLGDEPLQLGFLAGEAPYPESVEQRSREHEDETDEASKPNRLVKSRCHRYSERRPFLVPDAVAVGGDDPESVAPRRKLRVVRDPPAARLHPVLLESLEPVSESHRVGLEQAERRVMDLERLRRGRSRRRIGDPDVNRTVVDEHLFNRDRGPERIRGNVLWIDTNRAFDGGEPNPSVRRHHPRVRTSVALGVLHTVGGAVDDGVEPLPGAVGDLVELAFRYPVDAFVRAHPDVAQTVLDDAMNDVVRQALLLGDRGEAPVFQPVQPSSIGPNPEAPLGVLVEGEDEIVREAVFGRERGEAAVPEEVEPTAPRSDPEVSRVIFVDDVDGIVQRPSLVVKAVKRPSWSRLSPPA